MGHAKRADKGKCRASINVCRYFLPPCIHGRSQEFSLAAFAPYRLLGHAGCTAPDNIAVHL